MDVPNFLAEALTTQDKTQFEKIRDLAVEELKRTDVPEWICNANHVKGAANALSALSDKDRVNFILAALEPIHTFFNPDNRPEEHKHNSPKAYSTSMLVEHVMKMKLRLDERDVELLAQGFLTYKRGGWGGLTQWPLSSFVTNVGRNFPKGLPGNVKKSLEALRTELEGLPFVDKNTAKLISRIDSLLLSVGHHGLAKKPTLFMGKDEFTPYANGILEKLPAEQKQTWYKLLQLANKASGSKPSTKFLEESKKLMNELPGEGFKEVVVEWFDFLARLKESYQQHGLSDDEDYEDDEYGSYQIPVFLDAVNIDPIRALVWMSSQLADSRTLTVLASLCERSFKKIPAFGPAAPAIGNACLFALYESKTIEGISHLSRLKTRIKQTNTQSLIAKYLQQAADSKGMSVHQVEDLAVDEFGLNNGTKQYEIDGYKAILTVEGIGNVKVSWLKPDHSPLKSVPSIIKDKHADVLKRIKETTKQIDMSLSSQRQRIDRMFRSPVEMTWSYFYKNYVSHELMCHATKNVIWKLRNETEEVDAILLHDKWTTHEYKEVFPHESMRITLWHPALASADEIRHWRSLLLDKQIRQPIKQAFREVYLLTDAEVNARTYSNRMAAHILKQHQFNSLAKSRGWKYSLLGAYDDGIFNQAASLQLTQSNLRAEFWVNEVNAENQVNSSGIWNYVVTDQVRFVDERTNHPVELASIPPVMFSEVMRDVDLFVGVASVGNDPTWIDSGGVPAYRDYWQSYSFGELNEIAKTRKEILQNILPRLKIAPVASIRDRFLIVQGKKRTYKIHIGSTNILMEPNDQYLCIVPALSKEDTAGNLFLPFEGDAALSIILSKALLLADDDKIRDSTILSQINQN